MPSPRNGSTSPCEPQQVRTIRAISAGSQRAPRRIECEFQGFARQARHERTDEPSQADRNATTEGDRLALQVSAPVPLEKAPIRVQPPEIPAIVTDWLLALGGRTRVVDFRQTRAD